MSESKHTPGPWMWWTGCSWRRLGTADQSTLIMVPTVASDGHPDLSFPADGGVNGANALLIAAAPDLLEALEALLLENEGGGEMEAPEARAKARAAIAKAKGGE